MVLYKYVSEDRISILRDGLVRFSQPQAFNDPFELKPCVSKIMDRQRLESTIVTLFPQIIREEYEKQPLEFRRSIPLEVYLAFAESKKAELIDDIESFSGIVASGLEKTIHDGLERILGILSLTERPNNLLMWAHYANSHQGFVIELDASHKWFNKRKSGEDELRHLRKVSYSEVRPQAHLDQLDGLSIFLTKSKEWEYEQEWRMLLPLDDSDRIIKATPYDIHLFKIPFKAINSIIIGARATQATLMDIEAVIAGTSELSHLKLFRMSVHQQRFELVMCEQSSNNPLNSDAHSARAG